MKPHYPYSTSEENPPVLIEESIKTSLNFGLLSPGSSSILPTLCEAYVAPDSIEQVFYHSISIKEQEIVDYFLGSKLKDEVIKIMPVQKQTRAGQRTRFKAFVIIGDFEGHVGLGVKSAKVQTCGFD